MCIVVHVGIRMLVLLSFEPTRPVSASPSVAGGGGVRLPGGCPSGSVLTAREKVCSRRDSSNSAPKWPSPGAAAAHSRRPPRVAGAAARLQTAADGTGSTAYLLGHAADTTRTAAALSADRRSTPARCARSGRVRPRAHVCGRSRCGAAPPPPPRLPTPAPVSPSAHPTPLDSLPQVSMPTRRHHRAPAVGRACGPGASVTSVTAVTAAARACQPPARAPARAAVRAACAGRAGTQPPRAGRSPGRLSGVARAWLNRVSPVAEI